MQITELIGFAAGALVTISYLPQVIKSWKTKSTRDVSLFLGLINSIGQILWIVYGAVIHSSSLTAMSSLTLSLTLSLLFLKVKHG